MVGCEGVRREGCVGCFGCLRDQVLCSVINLHHLLSSSNNTPTHTCPESLSVPQELIALASQLPSLSGPASSSSSESSSSSTPFAVTGVGLVLGMINAREDVGECLVGDPAATSSLCCLMYLASTAAATTAHSSSAQQQQGSVSTVEGISSNSEGEWDLQAASVAAASARLRWPSLLQAVCAEVSTRIHTHTQITITRGQAACTEVHTDAHRYTLAHASKDNTNHLHW